MCLLRLLRDRTTTLERLHVVVRLEKVNSDAENNRMDEDGSHGGLASHPPLTANRRESEEHTGRKEDEKGDKKEHLYL